MGFGNPISRIGGELYHIKGDFKVDKNSRIGFKINGAEVLFDDTKGVLICMNKNAECKLEGGKVYLEIIVGRNTIVVFCNHGNVYMPAALDLQKNYGLELMCKNEYAQ